MAKPFHELRERLLRAGVAPRYVKRYLSELADHLADLTAEEERAGRSPAEATSEALLRLGTTDDLAKAMTAQRQLQSWSVRAPWAIFCLAPISLLAAAYFIACLILWSGWRIFLPGFDSPFVRIDGLAILYFGIGRSLYFAAPTLIGWAIGLIAARQRFNLVWPTIGWTLLTLIGVTAKVHALRPNLPAGKAGHISMSFSIGPLPQGIPDLLSQALLIFLPTVLPYLLWRFQQRRGIST
ncbi:permease prefix domain 1-containing protein [Tunturibacter empetritectus]|uniref:Uncharacterized protein n=1 Tax=Tunturiibacter lichenicola TaxID=2051959 RepID=A0A7W8J946_9BACT|nr:permease prefix domain 1-containing protein [Edaphobacter lichenicola]MBB5344947.1 hypothetical protein [Edaphobacter lichenicola]